MKNWIIYSLTMAKGNFSKEKLLSKFRALVTECLGVVNLLHMLIFHLNEHNSKFNVVSFSLRVQFSGRAKQLR